VGILGRVVNGEHTVQASFSSSCVAGRGSVGGAEKGSPKRVAHLSSSPRAEAAGRFFGVLRLCHRESTFTAAVQRTIYKRRFRTLGPYLPVSRIARNT
jgi:hypothetical protein